MRVKLLKAIRLAPNTPVRKPGEVVEVEDSLVEKFRGLGVFEEAEVSSEVQPDPAPVVEPEAEPVDEPVAEPTPAKNRPSRTAGIDDWRAFAKTKGVETKNLSKQEIIAATQ